jgi:hypothetical protein
MEPNLEDIEDELAQIIIRFLYEGFSLREISTLTQQPEERVKRVLRRFEMPPSTTL